MGDYLKNGWNNIFRKRLRAFLTMIGIAIGVMSVVIISMIGEVGKATIQSELSSMGIGGMLIRTENTKSTSQFGREELELVQNHPAVKTAAPLLTQYSNVKLKQKKSSCVVWGIDQDITEIVSMELLYGRMINRSDVTGLSKVCVIDESYAQKIYKRSNIVGKTLQIAINGSYEDFEIIGITKAGGSILQNLMGNLVPCFTYIPYTTMENLSAKSGFGQIVMQPREEEEVVAVTTSIAKEVENSSGVRVVVEDLNSQVARLTRILDIVTLVLTVISGISLLVAGLSIMTVMLVSVSERTREIGIKKSIGADSRMILLEFLTESFLLTGIGAAAGALIGVILGVIGCVVVGIAPLVNYQMILFSIGFAVVTGVLFGVYPAMKAAKMNPVEALRNES